MVKACRDGHRPTLKCCIGRLPIGTAIDDVSLSQLRLQRPDNKAAIRGNPPAVHRPQLPPPATAAPPSAAPPTAPPTAANGGDKGAPSSSKPPSATDGPPLAAPPTASSADGGEKGAPSSPKPTTATAGLPSAAPPTTADNDEKDAPSSSQPADKLKSSPEVCPQQNHTLFHLMVCVCFGYGCIVQPNTYDQRYSPFN